MAFRHGGHIEHEINQGLLVDGSLAAHAIKDLAGIELVKHAPGIVAGQRDGPEGDILQHFHKNAAQAKHHDGAKYRVLNHPDNDLDRKSTRLNSSHVSI